MKTSGTFRAKGAPGSCHSCHRSLSDHASWCSGGAVGHFAGMHASYNATRAEGERFVGIGSDCKYSCCGYAVCACAPSTPEPPAPVQAGERAGWTLQKRCDAFWSSCRHYAGAPDTHVWHADVWCVTHGYLCTSDDPRHSEHATLLDAQLHVERELAAAQPQQGAEQLPAGWVDEPARGRLVREDKRAAVWSIDATDWVAGKPDIAGLYMAIWPGWERWSGQQPPHPDAEAAMRWADFMLESESPQ